MKYQWLLSFIIIISSLLVIRMLMDKYNYTSVGSHEPQILSGPIVLETSESHLQQIQEYTNPKTFSYLKSLPISKDVVVHSAYFDDRPRDGHSNITIFFADVNKTIFDSKWITGCGVGNVITKEFLVRYVAEDIPMHNVLGPKRFLYEQLAIECYDLPVKDGSKAFLIYKIAQSSSEEIVTESENPLMIPAPRIQPTGKYNFTVVTCTKAHNRKVTWFPEFVRYQKTLGVDHVHISILDTFIKDGGIHDFMTNEPSLREAAREGYLSFSVWKEWYKDRGEVYLHSEALRKLDCMYRYRGTYDYVFPLDTDDFFTPRVPGKTQLKDYIHEYCYVKPYASCTFDWIQFHPGECGMKSKVGEDGNVTNHLVSHKMYPQDNPKSLHSTHFLIDATFHTANCKGCLMPGYKTVIVPPHVAYVAHNINSNAKGVC